VGKAIKTNRDGHYGCFLAREVSRDVMRMGIDGHR
jgi:hypothetical protein